MIRAAVLVLFALALAPLAAAQTAIKGDWITLGDVAPVTGEHAGILLGPAPPPGQTLALDPAFLIATAKKAAEHSPAVARARSVLPHPGGP